jgi:hypothetical protein
MASIGMTKNTNSQINAGADRRYGAVDRFGRRSGGATR